MIHTDALIRAINAEGWGNLLSLTDRANLRRLAGLPPGEHKPKSRLFVIYEGERALTAYHTEKGSVLGGFRWPGPDKIEEVARRENADRVVAVHRDAIASSLAAYRNKVGLEGNYVGQLIEIYNTLAGRVDRDVFIYPPRGLRPVGFDAAHRGFNFLIPSDSALLFYVFDDDGKLWASVIAGVTDAEIDLVTTHDALGIGGVKISSWEKDYRKIISAVGKTFRKPSVGIFCRLGPLARVLLERKPLPALARARKKGDIILDPLPWRMKAILRAGRLFA